MQPPPPTPDEPPVTVEALCVRLPAKADNPASLAPGVERRPLVRGANELLVEVKAAAVNPSAVKPAPVGWADALYHHLSPESDPHASTKAGFGIMLYDLVSARRTVLVFAPRRWL